MSHAVARTFARGAASLVALSGLIGCGDAPEAPKQATAPRADLVEIGLVPPAEPQDAAYFVRMGLSAPEPRHVESVYGAITRPIPGLTTDQQTAFQRGGDLFSHAFTPLEGLGPLANSNSCGTCHQGGGIGGPGHEVEHRMGLVNLDDPNWMVTGNGFYEMTELGGPVQQGDAGAGAEPLPPLDAVQTLVANLAARGITAGPHVIVSARSTPIVAGDGLLSSIPDATLLARASLSRPFGITGHANVLTGAIGDLPLTGRVGRLGHKAQLPDNEAFLADAAVQELGLSNPHNAIENVSGAPAQQVARRDLTQAQLDDTLTFCTGLAPVVPYDFDTAGQAAFYKAGCAVCHFAGYSTERDALKLPPSLQGFGAALVNKPVPAYTDLLVHDMGRGLGDGFVQGSAGGGQWRTPPLWGLRFKTTFMHDGGSFTLEAAIARHLGDGSEANQVIENYLGTSTRNPSNNLSPAEREALMTFLKKL